MIAAGTQLRGELTDRVKLISWYMAKEYKFEGLGKLPPQAIELEEAVLGSLIMCQNKEYIYSLVKPEIFYKDANQKICAVIVKLHGDRKPIDILTVRAELARTGKLDEVGGVFYITELTDKVASSAHTEYHLLIITQKFLQREIIRVSTEAINRCYDEGDPFEEMARLVKEIDRLKKKIFKRSERNMRDLLKELAEDRVNVKENAEIIGLSSGKKGLDYMTKGHQPNQLVIKAARPGMGKTADMCSEILNCCFDDSKEPLEAPTPVGCFSLEMSGKSLVNRMLSNLSSIKSLQLRLNRLSDQEIIRKDYYENLLAEAPIIIDDTSGLTIDEFESKAALWVAIYGVKKIYIDYLQLMLGSPMTKYQNREAEVSEISRRLKRCAKELDITIIALCQLSRQVEGRKWNLPILSDLRESGSIEQDADIVELLWRPEYYPEVMADLNKDGKGIDFRVFNGLKITDYNGLIITIVAKCREGETGNVPHKFKADIMRVYDHPQAVDCITNKQREIFTPPTNWLPDQREDDIIPF